MFSRICAAACAALVIAAFAPQQSAARGGGGSGAVGAIHAGGFHPMARPMPRAHAPIAHARQTPPTLLHPVLRANALRAAASRHRGAFGCCGYGAGYPITNADDGPFYGAYYDPSDFARWANVPAYAGPSAPPTPIAERPEQLVDRGSCRSETVAVPFAGGDRSITIMRC